MSKELCVIVQGVNSAGEPFYIDVPMTARQFMSHIKQMTKSLAETGVVHEIEDRQNPFNGIAVNRIELFRSEDIDDTEEDDFDDDDF